MLKNCHETQFIWFRVLQIWSQTRVFLIFQVCHCQLVSFFPFSPYVKAPFHPFISPSSIFPHLKSTCNQNFKTRLRLCLHLQSTFYNLKLVQNALKIHLKMTLKVSITSAKPLTPLLQSLCFTHVNLVCTHDLRNQ